jgi:hypothetical protein
LGSNHRLSTFKSKLHSSARSGAPSFSRCANQFVIDDLEELAAATLRLALLLYCLADGNGHGVSSNVITARQY